MSGDPVNLVPSSLERLPELHPYVVVLFRRVSDRPILRQEEADRIHSAHLAHLAKLHEAGDLIISGPIEEESDLRELLLFRDGPIGRVRELVETDPAVVQHRLSVELFTWRAVAGLQVGRPPRPASVEEE